jgi:hypothetical protein
MPRKEFQKDLVQASIPNRFPRLKNVRAGEEHGSILFTYTVPFSTQTIDFQSSVLGVYSQFCPSIDRFFSSVTHPLGCRYF